MVGNRTILIGMIVAVAGLVATEYATAHHVIAIPHFASDAAELSPASAGAVEAPSAASE